MAKEPSKREPSKRKPRESVTEKEYSTRKAYDLQGNLIEADDAARMKYLFL